MRRAYWIGTCPTHGEVQRTTRHHPSELDRCIYDLADPECREQLRWEFRVEHEPEVRTEVVEVNGASFWWLMLYGLAGGLIGYILGASS